MDKITHYRAIVRELIQGKIWIQHDGTEDGSCRRKLCEPTHVWRLKRQNNILFGDAGLQQIGGNPSSVISSSIQNLPFCSRT